MADAASDGGERPSGLLGSCLWGTSLLQLWARQGDQLQPEVGWVELASLFLFGASKRVKLEYCCKGVCVFYHTVNFTKWTIVTCWVKALPELLTKVHCHLGSKGLLSDRPFARSSQSESKAIQQSMQMKVPEGSGGIGECWHKGAGFYMEQRYISSLSVTDCYTVLNNDVLLEKSWLNPLCNMVQ